MGRNIFEIFKCCGNSKYLEDVVIEKNLVLNETEVN